METRGLTPSHTNNAPHPDNAAASNSLRIPAIGLAITSALNLLLPLCVIGVALLKILLSITHPGSHSNLNIAAPDILILAIIAFLLLASCGANLFILLTARRLRRLQSYQRCMAACIVAAVTGLVIPTNLLSLPFAIWALVVLAKPETRDAFDAPRSSALPRWPQPPKEVVVPPPHSRGTFSRTTFLGLTLTALTVASLTIFPRAPLQIILLEFLLMIATSVIGIIAIRRIRRSVPQKRGLPFALLATLLFPILSLDVLIAVLCYALVTAAIPLRDGPFSDIVFVQKQTFFATALAIIAILILDFLIARCSWRIVSQPTPIRSALWPLPRPLRFALLSSIGILLVAVAAIYTLNLNQFQHAERLGFHEPGMKKSAKIRYRVFELPAAVVDQLVPVSERSDSEAHQYETAEVTQTTADKLASSVKPPDRVDDDIRFFTLSAAMPAEGLTAFTLGKKTTFTYGAFNFANNPRLQVAGTLAHITNAASDLTSPVQWRGDLPEDDNARLFLIPYVNKKGVSRYFIFACNREPFGTPSQERSDRSPAVKIIPVKFTQSPSAEARIHYDYAQKQFELAKIKNQMGRISPADLAQAEADFNIAAAELTSDPAKIAQARFDGAQKLFDIAQTSYRVGRISPEEFTKAQRARDLAAAATQPATSPASLPKGTP